MAKLKLFIRIIEGLIELALFLYVAIGGPEWERAFAILVIGVLFDIRRKTKSVIINVGGNTP